MPSLSEEVEEVVVFTGRRKKKVSLRVKIEGGEEMLGSRRRLSVVLAAWRHAVLLLLSSILMKFFYCNAGTCCLGFRWSPMTTRVLCERVQTV